MAIGGRASLHAYCDHLLVAAVRIRRESIWPWVLRRSRIDGAKHAAAVIKLLVTRLRGKPGLKVHLIVRGDSVSAGNT